MLEKTTIARPYAQAIFELAREQGALASWSEQLATLAQIAADEDMQRLLSDPRISKAQLESLVLEIAGDKLPDSGRNLVKVLIGAERFEFCAEIRALFEALKADAEKLIEVEISSAFPLDESEKQKLSEAMRSRLGRSVELNANEDSSLIGGVVVRAGDEVIDLSLRGRLEQMASEFN